MNKLTRRVAVTASSVAVASAAVLGAGVPHRPRLLYPRTSSVRPSVSTPHDHRWDHGVGYLLELGYSWDEIRGWCHDVQVEISVR